MRSRSPQQTIADVLHKHRHIIPLLTGTDWWHDKSEHRLTPDNDFIQVQRTHGGARITIQQPPGDPPIVYEVTVDEQPR